MYIEKPETIFALLNHCLDFDSLSEKGVKVGKEATKKVERAYSRSDQEENEVEINQEALYYFRCAVAFLALEAKHLGKIDIETPETKSHEFTVSDIVPENQAFIFKALAVGMLLEGSWRELFLAATYALGFHFLRVKEQLAIAREIKAISEEEENMLSYLFYLANGRRQFESSSMMAGVELSLTKVYGLLRDAIIEGERITPLLANYFFQFLEESTFYIAYERNGDIVLENSPSFLIRYGDQLRRVSKFNYFTDIDILFPKQRETDRRTAILNILEVIKFHTQFEKDQDEDPQLLELLAYMLRFKANFKTKMEAFTLLNLVENEVELIKKLNIFAKRFVALFIELTKEAETLEVLLDILSDYLLRGSAKDEEQRAEIVATFFKAIRTQVGIHHWNKLVERLGEAAGEQVSTIALIKVINSLEKHNKHVSKRKSTTPSRSVRRKMQTKEEKEAIDSVEAIDTRFPTKVEIKAGSPLFDTKRSNDMNLVIRFFKSFKSWNLDYWRSKVDPHRLATDVQVIDCGDGLRMIGERVDDKLIIYDLMTHADYDNWQNKQSFWDPSLGVRLDSEFKDKANKTIADRS